MKRMIAWMTALVLCLSGVQAVAAEGAYTDPELVRAVMLDFGPYSAEDPFITYAKFFLMLDKAVELADPAKLAEWQALLPDARAASQPILRCEAMLALYFAAETLGPEYVADNGGSELAFPILEKAFPGDESLGFGDTMASSSEYGLFPSYVGDTDRQTQYQENWYVPAAYYLAFKRLSLLCGKSLFDLAPGPNPLRTDAELTYTQALLAALRLHDSAVSIGEERVATDADREILRLAEARKQAILSSPTTVEVTGTKYYVSNEGSDKNSGKSPDKAWASIKKVNAAKLKPGDGVFFRRGDLWRDYMIVCQKGVTYSAYGDGEKPRFYGSPENGANPDFWTLVPGSENVWVYHRKMNECGSIVFNDGEKMANKYPAYWHAPSKQYVVSLDMQTPFTVDVLEDNWFFNETDLKTLKPRAEITDATALFENGSALFFWYEDLRGKLYLRCDAGNPGTVYQSIEFSKDPHGGKKGGNILLPAEGNVIDNLCMRYIGNSAMSLFNGTTVQNCEISYSGGGAYAYLLLARAPFEVEHLMDLICFDGVALVSLDPSNVRIQNNYIHDCFRMPYNIEHHLKRPIENFQVSGNLFERNGAGGNILNFYPNDDKDVLRFKNLLFDDNYWMYTGYGWGEQGLRDSHEVLGFQYYSEKQFENIVFSNNILYLSKNALFVTHGNATLEPFTFSGNTYAHRNFGALLAHYGDGLKDVRFYSYDLYAAETIKQLTGDEAAVVLPLSW